MSTLARPGPVLRGTSLFCLMSWVGLLFLVTLLPPVAPATALSAIAMATLFLCLLAAQLAGEVRADASGLRATTFFRVVRCPWSGVGGVRAQSVLPGITLYFVSTAAGPIAFSSLWSGHRELLAALAARRPR